MPEKYIIINNKIYKYKIFFKLAIFRALKKKNFIRKVHETIN